MDAISVDIENEFTDIAADVAHLSAFLTTLPTRQVADDAQIAWEAALICASATEKIYNGCERVMAKLASDVDNAAIAHRDGWHSTLLKRMAHPFPDRRPAILSEDCYRRLDRLRAFRHRQRNSYGTHLDYDIVVARGAEAVSAFELFCEDVRVFFRSVTG